MFFLLLSFLHLLVFPFFVQFFFSQNYSSILSHFFSIRYFHIHYSACQYFKFIWEHLYWFFFSLILYITTITGNMPKISVSKTLSLLHCSLIIYLSLSFLLFLLSPLYFCSSFFNFSFFFSSIFLFFLFSFFFTL